MISFQTQQVLVPKKVYIGDAAELRVTFNSQQEISAVGFSEEVDFKDYSIQDIKILPAGVNYYQLTITFVPWKTGNIKFPDYELKAGTELCSIKFEPVNIVSIIEQNGISSLRESQAPLLLPGTTYKLYGAIIAAVFLLAAGIQLIIKREKVSLFLKNQKLLRKYRKNRRSTEKALSGLLEETPENLSDNVFAAEVQKIMRQYLEVRFAYPFKNCVTSQLMQGFYTATAETLSEIKEEVAQDIAGIFIRTDFIRYGHNSLSEAKAQFEQNERSDLVERLKNDIDVLEKEEKAEKEDKNV